MSSNKRGKILVDIAEYAAGWCWDNVFARMVELPEWKQGLEAKLVEYTCYNARATRKLMETEYAALAATLADLGLAKQKPAFAAHFTSVVASEAAAADLPASYSGFPGSSA